MTPEDSTSPVSQNSEWISVKEFAIREGVTERTVYNRISEGTYNSRLGKDGRKEVLWIGNDSETVSKDLHNERIRAVRLEEKLSSTELVLAGLRAELARADETIATQKAALAACQTANEALNNERLVVTQQLQKYREPEKLERPWWQVWR